MPRICVHCGRIEKVQTYVEFRVAHTRPAGKPEWKDADLVFVTGRAGKAERYKLINLDDIERKMYSRAVRVLTRDVFPDMPPEFDEDRSCELEPAARKAYRDMERSLVAEVGKGVSTASNAGVKVLRLLQLTGGTLVAENLETGERAGVVVSTAKAELLTELLRDSDEPTVVFGRFHSDLDAIHRACYEAGLPVQAELSGRANQLENWKAGQTQVLVTQVQAGGVGISLVRAAHAIYYSTGASLIDYIQSRSRFLGSEQTRPVTFTHLLAEGTHDVTAYRALLARQDVVAAVVERVRSGNVLQAVER